MLTTRQKHIAQVLGCLTLVYISWGSCFISIKFAIESFPPFMMCGLRMMLAGVLLYLWSWARGERNLPTRKDLSQSFVLAFFMVFMASGFLAKGQESISSGTAAMILGAVPIWMVLGGWLFCGDPRPSLVQFFGLGTGFAGLILLSVNQTASGTDSGWGILLVLCAAFGWVTGSFLSKKQASETQLSVIQTSGLLMFIGGLQSLVGAAVLGEFSTFSMDSVTPLSAGRCSIWSSLGRSSPTPVISGCCCTPAPWSPFPTNTSIRSSAYSSAGCSLANRWTASSSRPAA